MYYINLVHSQIDIFDSNHWRPHDVIELHNKLKDKMQPNKWCSMQGHRMEGKQVVQHNTA
jgi:hypothetical protein